MKTLKIESPQKLNFSEIYTEADKVYNSNLPHFFALTALFTFPFVFSLLTFQYLQYLQITNIHLPQDYINLKLIIYVVFFYICATATITHSSYNIIFDRNVKFMHAIKFLSKSFIRLFATFFCAQTIIFGSSISVGLIVFGIVKGFECLGIQIQYCSKYFIVLEALLGYGLLYLCVNWCLVPVIVVVEKSWGLESLRRSAYLVKGGRGVVLCLMLYFGFIFCLAAFVTWFLASNGGALAVGALAVVTLLVNSIVLTTFLRNCFTINTVLYMKCKALHGEITEKIVEEFAHEFVRLPLDEEEDAPPFVSDVQLKYSKSIV